MKDTEKGARLLRAGQLVVFPTETVYGLGADALDPRAIEKIFKAKGRPRGNPLIVHVASVGMARGLSDIWPDAADQLAERFWPGPLTVVVPKARMVPGIVTAGLPSVGLRMPAHPIALELISSAGIPVAAPSANRFTELSPTTAAHAQAAFPHLFVIDGGPCRVGIESTVVSFAGERPKILRPGMVTQTQIEDVIGPVDVGAGPESPGQHPKHYSPQTRIVIGAPLQEGKGEFLTMDSMPGDAAGYAEQLYARLHDLDKLGLDWIAIELPPDQPEWAGIRDRLMRAAGGLTEEQA